MAAVADQLAAADLDGRSVCVLVPDGTRSCPVPLLLVAVRRGPWRGDSSGRAA